MGDRDRFLLALSQITGKRLTYEHLTGKDLEPEGALPNESGSAEENENPPNASASPLSSASVLAFS